MRCFLIHCDGYRVIREVIVNGFEELPKLCRAAEIELYGENGDGYAVVASHNGDFVADADGVTSHWEPSAEYQAGLDYACGYRD
jgi:hypothetical protein